MQTVTTAVAHEVIAAAPGVVLVDVTAEWCAPCKAITPILRQMHADTEGLTVLSVDAETEPGFVAEFDVMSFPTLLFFADGALVHRLTGARGLAAMREEVARVKASVGAPQ